MTSAGWPIVALVLMVIGVLAAQRHLAFTPLFRWLPVPLWCYALPALGVQLGWLPHGHPTYRLLTDTLLPFALGLLLLGTDLPSLLRSGGKLLAAALIGTAGVIAGTPLAAWILRGFLPPDAWKGAGALAGTWTGGTMNLLALRSVLKMREELFAPLIVVDAMVAYGWMALLVAASAAQEPLNRWLRISPAAGAAAIRVPAASPLPHQSRALLIGAAASAGVAFGSRALAQQLPTSGLVSSATGWTILLVTTVTLSLSLFPAIRRLGARGSALGSPVLYLVLAATGSQARLDALLSTPVWIVLGLIVVLVHGGLLLLAGRVFRIPLGLLATASQADIGGVVSAPLVGAVYHQSLVPVGLLLAIAGNALGTYLGLLAATLARWLTR